MDKRLQASWDSIRTSLLLIPSVLTLVGFGLALAVLGLDARRTLGGPDGWTWLHGGSGDDARNLLSTLLTSTITMASMAFSVTIVALTLAANAHGPRLIRIFRSDLRTQAVLGTFVMTIVYCLVVLRSIEGAAPPAEVPHLAVTFGTGLALVCVLSLLAFIQGVARLIVSDEVVRRVRAEVESAIAKLHPPGVDPPVDPTLPAGFDATATLIELPREGYVQAVDFDGLRAWAEREGLVLRLDFRPGDFVVDGDRRLAVFPPVDDPERVRSALDRFIVSGDERTPTQDLEFAIRHLVEIAVRALSPGINDPFTALACIDRLRGCLSRLMARAMPAPALAGPTGTLRVVRAVPTIDGVFDAAFNQIRDAASAKPAVLIHMMEALAGIAEHVRTHEQREALARHADLIRAAGERAVADPSDRAAVFARHAATIACIAAVDRRLAPSSSVDATEP